MRHLDKFCIATSTQSSVEGVGTLLPHVDQ